MEKKESDYGRLKFEEFVGDFINRQMMSGYLLTAKLSSSRRIAMIAFEIKF